jgi:DNA-binding GntR family transcriptional regulator
MPLERPARGLRHRLEVTSGQRSGVYCVRMESDGNAAWPISVSTADIDGILARLLGVDERQDSLVGKIAIEIARDIIEERVGQSDDLNSFDLAQRFGTSRTPVREALLVLERQGMVEVPARRRPRAAEFTRQTIIEIYDLRSELYGLVARQIVENASDADLDTLERHLAGLVSAAESGDDDAYFWQVVLFHEQASLVCGNATLKRTIDGLGLRVMQLRHLGMARGWRIERSLADHQRLMLALRERDGQLAAALNRAMATNALPGLLAIVDGRGPDSR